MSTVSVTTDNFDEIVTKSTLPVLIDFFATWCGPCKMLSPLVDEVAEELQGQVLVCKINVDENPEIAQRFGISVIPTLVVVQNGQVKETSTGYIPKESILALLQS